MAQALDEVVQLRNEAAPIHSILVLFGRPISCIQTREQVVLQEMKNVEATRRLILLYPVLEELGLQLHKAKVICHAPVRMEGQVLHIEVVSVIIQGQAQIVIVMDEKHVVSYGFQEADPHLGWFI